MTTTRTETPTTDATSPGPVTGEVPVGIRIRAHPGLCMGWGNCRAWGPSVYFLDDDGQIGFHFLEVPPELADDAYRGAHACPEQAITVIRPIPDRRERRTGDGP